MNNAFAAGVPALKSQLIENEKINCTFLTEENINHLKRMFKTKEDYIKFMACFWVNRDLIVNEMGDNTRHPLFPLFDAINNLIGSLLLSENYIFFENAKHGYVTCNGEIIYLQDIMRYEFKPFWRK